MAARHYGEASEAPSNCNGAPAASHTASIKRRTARASQSIRSIGAFQYSDMTYAAWRAFTPRPATVRAGIAMTALSTGSRRLSIASICSRWSSGEAEPCNFWTRPAISSNCLPMAISAESSSAASACKSAGVSVGDREAPLASPTIAAPWSIADSAADPGRQSSALLLLNLSVIGISAPPTGLSMRGRTTFNDKVLNNGL